MCDYPGPRGFTFLSGEAAKQIAGSRLRRSKNKTSGTRVMCDLLVQRNLDAKDL